MTPMYLWLTLNLHMVWGRLLGLFVAQTHNHRDCQVVQRHQGQTGGAQLGPPAAEVTQTHDHKDGQVVQRHEGQIGRAQLGPQLLK